MTTETLDDAERPSTPDVPIIRPLYEQPLAEVIRTAEAEIDAAAGLAEKIHHSRGLSGCDCGSEVAGRWNEYREEAFRSIGVYDFDDLARYGRRLKKLAKEGKRALADLRRAINGEDRQRYTDWEIEHRRELAERGIFAEMFEPGWPAGEVGQPSALDDNDTEDPPGDGTEQ